MPGQTIVEAINLRHSLSTLGRTRLFTWLEVKYVRLVVRPFGRKTLILLGALLVFVTKVTASWAYDNIGSAQDIVLALPPGTVVVDFCEGCARSEFEISAVYHAKAVEQQGDYSVVVRQELLFEGYSKPGEPVTLAGLSCGQSAGPVGLRDRKPYELFDADYAYRSLTPWFVTTHPKPLSFVSMYDGQARAGGVIAAAAWNKLRACLRRKFDLSQVPKLVEVGGRVNGNRPMAERRALKKSDHASVQSERGFMIIYGGGKTPADARAAYDEYVSRDQSRFGAAGILSSPDYPRLLRSETVSGLRPGYFILALGVCDRAEGQRMVQRMSKLKQGIYGRVVRGVSRACPSAVKLGQPPTAQQMCARFVFPSVEHEWPSESDDEDTVAESEDALGDPVHGEEVSRYTDVVVDATVDSEDPSRFQRGAARACQHGAFEIEWRGGGWSCGTISVSGRGSSDDCVSWAKWTWDETYLWCGSLGGYSIATVLDGSEGSESEHVVERYRMSESVSTHSTLHTVLDSALHVCGETTVVSTRTAESEPVVDDEEGLPEDNEWIEEEPDFGDANGSSRKTTRWVWRLGQETPVEQADIVEGWPETCVSSYYYQKVFGGKQPMLVYQQKVHPDD